MVEFYIWMNLTLQKPDVLLRLDEALDDRRQIVLKEAEGQVIKAFDDWFVYCHNKSIVPRRHKELPPQILSRFPVRLRLNTPQRKSRMQIIKQHVNFTTSNEKDIGMPLNWRIV